MLGRVSQYVCGFFWLGAVTVAPIGMAQEAVSFRQDIQPILSRYCFACHGPDAEQRQGDLRLDQEAAAKVSAIVAGQPNESPLIERIRSEDPSAVMPPPDTGHQLTEAEKSLLERWIASGAKYESHWAFEPIQRPPLPEAVDGAVSHPIDRFVLAEQKRRGLRSSPPAQPHQLLRRVHFDLIGLPPAPEVAAEYLASPTAENYNRMIASLLKSPHYGEHMAATWLDLARYADTNGYQNDFYRSQWPWRDWVIASFNRHQRFDEFLVQQLAGDLLPEPTTDQLVATGFNRNNRSVTEGGSIEEEWRIENCAERTETVATTFLGLTMGCARCHDHKYDPIERRDYYQFFAFFNNIDEQGVYIETRGNTGPQVKVPTAQQAQELADAERQVADLQSRLQEEQTQRTADVILAEWTASLAADSVELATPSFEALQSTFAGADADTWSPVGKATVMTGAAATASLGDHWELIDRATPFSWSIWVHGSSRGALFSKMNEDESYRGFDGIILEDGKVKIHLIHQWSNNAVAIVSQQPLQAASWQQLTVTYDGSSKAAGLKLYLDGKPAAVDVEIDSLTESIRNQAQAYVGQRSKSLQLHGRVAKFAWFDSALSSAAVVNWHRQNLTTAAKALAPQLDAEYSSQQLSQYIASLSQSELSVQLQAATARRDQLLQTQQTCMIMRDRSDYRPTHMLRRGQYDLPDTSIDLWPVTPQVLPPQVENQPANRLGLARWMVDPRNPLVARVAVNRIWAQFFGRGLVETVDNFGVQGSPPTHPELLDWLAMEFRDSGWDIQHIQRLILTSQTYQQASEHRSEAAAVDPSNLWLWRGPRHRLSGEQLRDQALFVSQLLTTTIGGPSVYPYQPAGLWEELAGGANDGPYKASTGADLYRRGLYTYRKRTVSHPTLATFDAPSWEICYARRATTNTPLQALALWNDPTYVEAARQLSVQLLKGRPLLNDGKIAPSDKDYAQSVADAIRVAYKSMLYREPTDAELTQLTASYQQFLQHYREHETQAEEFARIGQSEVNAAWNRPALAALTMTISVIMNTDEFVTKE